MFTKAAGEFPEQINRIKADYANGVGEFDFKVLGPAQIFELLNMRERRGTPVDDRLTIVYDQNKANLLEHSIEGAAGIICTIEAKEIARVVNQHPTIFDDNLRRFLGFGGAVNRAIGNSCKSNDDAPLFWFLNNGISIVCDDYDVNKDSDHPFIELKNMRIVNGCQTSTTIAAAAQKGELHPSTRVMLRVFKTKSADLASKLVITTNN